MTIPTAKELFKHNFANNDLTAEALMENILEKIVQRYNHNQYNSFFYNEQGFSGEILSRAHLEAIKTLQEKGYKINLALKGLEIDYISAVLDDGSYFTRDSTYSKIKKSNDDSSLIPKENASPSSERVYQFRCPNDE